MVNHVVTFKFKGDAQTRLEVAKKFKAALDELPRLINAVQIIKDYNEARACVDYITE